jgi:predicted outer membrane repeat protein
VAVLNGLAQDGGAVYLTGGDIEIDSCRFEGNNAVNGGAIYAVVSDGESFAVHDSAIYGNFALYLKRLRTEHR